MGAFELGRILWEARTREAWGSHSAVILARTPWPEHEAHPERAAAHDLAIAEARALLKVCTVTKKEPK